MRECPDRDRVSSRDAPSANWPSGDRPARGPHAHLRLRVRQVRRRVRGVAVVRRGPAEEAPRAAAASSPRSSSPSASCSRARASTRTTAAAAPSARTASSDVERVEVVDSGSEVREIGAKSEAHVGDRQSDDESARQSDSKESDGEVVVELDVEVLDVAGSLLVSSPAPPSVLPPSHLAAAAASPLREGPAMLRRSPRALALWGGRARRRRGHRRGRRRPTSPRSTGAPPTSGPSVDAVVATRDLAVGTVLAARRPRACAACTGRSSPPGSSPIATRRRGTRRGGAGADGRATSRAATSRRAGAPGSTASCPRACGRSASWSPTRSRRAPAPRSTCSRRFDPRRGSDAAATRPSWSPPASPCSRTDRARRRAAPAAPAPPASRCSSIPTRPRALADAQANGVVTLALVPPEERRPARVASASRRSGSVVGPPRHHPRDRAGTVGVPADLVERPPHPRARAVRLDRAHVERLARTRRSTSRCTSAR